MSLDLNWRENPRCQYPASSTDRFCPTESMLTHPLDRGVHRNQAAPFVEVVPTLTVPERTAIFGVEKRSSLPTSMA